MLFHLHFLPQATAPQTPGKFLLWNQCDGYHHAEARFFEDGSFRGFFTFMGDEFPADTYQAWARLPDTACLYEQFGDKPRDGMSAHEVTLDRIKRQAAPGA
jgi:hypothetical protein